MQLTLAFLLRLLVQTIYPTSIIITFVLILFWSLFTVTSSDFPMYGYDVPLSQLDGRTRPGFPIKHYCYPAIIQLPFDSHRTGSHRCFRYCKYGRGIINQETTAINSEKVKSKLPIILRFKIQNRLSSIINDASLMCNDVNQSAPASSMCTICSTY